MENYTLTVGTVDTGRASRAVLTVDIEYVHPGEERLGQVRPDGCLAITYSEKRPGAKDIDAGGALGLAYAEYADRDMLQFSPGWNASRFMRLLEIADRWHLNDMRAGCVHQRWMGWTYDEHPSEPCPVCGYRMGSAWLSERVPDEVLNELRAMAA